MNTEIYGTIQISEAIDYKKFLSELYHLCKKYSADGDIDFSLDCANDKGLEEYGIDEMKKF